MDRLCHTSRRLPHDTSPAVSVKGDRDDSRPNAHAYVSSPENEDRAGSRSIAPPRLCPHDYLGRVHPVHRRDRHDKNPARLGPMLTGPHHHFPTGPQHHLST